MIKRLNLLLLTLLVSCYVANATIQSVDYSRAMINLDKFEVLDIEFNSREGIQKPFAVQFDAVFTSPSGKSQTLPGFYNGGNDWIVRFSASEPGEWVYTTKSELKSLNNRSGKITVSAANYGDRRGMITRNSDSPNHFFWEDGTPYFLMAFECDFLFALDYKDRDEKPKLNHFLDRVGEQGFNHMMMNLYAHDVIWVKDEKLKDTPQYEVGGDQSIYPFLGSNESPDYSALNVEFFQQFDRTMEALNDRNIISHLMIYVWNKAVNWPEFSSEEDNMYFDYIIKRYQAFTNIVWDISKEAIFYGNIGDEYILERIDRVRNLDSYKRLITVHDYGFCVRNKDKVDFAARQDWKLSAYDNMLKSWSLFTDKPILNIEHGGYEESDYDVWCGNYINAENCLRRNYECLFAGVYSTYYWQGCSWNVMIYDFDELSDNSYKPKMHYYKNMYDFFTKYPYHNLRPVPEYNNSGYVMTDDNGTYLIYLPKESYKCATGKIMSQANKLSFQWYNVQTGEYSDVTTASAMDIFSNPPAPWHMESDAILIVEIVESK